MLTRIAIIFAILISLFSCISHQRDYITNTRRDDSRRTIPIYIDQRFSGNDKVLISSALQSWGYAFNNQINFEIHYNVSDWSLNEVSDIYLRHGVMIVYLSERENDNIPTLSSDPFNAKKVLAWVNKIGGNKINVLRDRINETDLYYIILHEMGHIFGVLHTNEDELMQPSYMKTNQRCVDQNTARKAAEFMGVNPNTMNWCL